MIAQVNLETGEVVSVSRLFELNPPEYIECPDDWHPTKYSYSNGVFTPIEQQEQDPRIAQLVATGLFTEQQAILFIAAQNNS